MTEGAIRLDKWLWQARFLKSRSLAAALVSEGRVRVNGERAVKPARTILPGDVLTFPQGGRVRVVRVIATGERRGPAVEAQTLYDDLEAPEGAQESETGRDAASSTLE
jgi:ribosome-associated heat shock protein Hsp15